MCVGDMFLISDKAAGACNLEDGSVAYTVGGMFLMSDKEAVACNSEDGSVAYIVVNTLDESRGG